MKIEYIGYNEKNEDVFIAKREDNRIVFTGATLSQLQNAQRQIGADITANGISKEEELRQCALKFDNNLFVLNRQLKDVNDTIALVQMYYNENQ